MGQSSNQCVVPIHIDRKIGLFSFSKYYRMSTNYVIGFLEIPTSHAKWVSRYAVAGHGIKVAPPAYS
jgi:hypothetical protein